MPQTVKWVNGNTAVINGSNKYKFVGIVRGQGHPAISYIADSVEELTTGLILDDWIYYIKSIKNRPPASDLRKSKNISSTLIITHFSESGVGGIT